MKLSILAFAISLVSFMPCNAQHLGGPFKHGYSATSGAISIEIIGVHSSPRCKAEDNCPWAIVWHSRKRSLTVEISVTVAGFDSPVAVQVVPGQPAASKDRHNPVFRIPLQTVRQIDFRLWNGSKDLGSVTFR